MGGHLASCDGFSTQPFFSKAQWNRTHRGVLGGGQNKVIRSGWCSRLAGTTNGPTTT